MQAVKLRLTKARRQPSRLHLIQVGTVLATYGFTCTSVPFIHVSHKERSEALLCFTGKSQPAQQEDTRQDAAKGRAAEPGEAVSSQAQAADAAPAVAQGSKVHFAQPEPARLLQSSAPANKQQDG